MWQRKLFSTSPALTQGWNLTLNDEQREFQELAKKFTREEITPKAAHYDKVGEYPWDIVKKAHSVGLMNGHIPQEYGMPILWLLFSFLFVGESILIIRVGIVWRLGGLGLSVFDGCLILEELAFGCTGISLAIEGSSLGVSI